MERSTKLLQIGNLTEGAKRKNPQRRRVYDPRGIAPCICGGGRGHDTDVPKILIRHGPKSGSDGGGVTEAVPNIKNKMRIFAPTMMSDIGNRESLNLQRRTKRKSQTDGRKVVP